MTRSRPLQAMARCGFAAWLRPGQADSTILTLLRLALVVAPFFVMLAAVGGYVLARRAFRLCGALRRRRAR